MRRAWSSSRTGYLGIHDFAKDKEGPREHLRLLANIQTPNYFLVAVDAKSPVTDLRQIVDQGLAVKLVARGGVDEPINAAVLAHYGLSAEKIRRSAARHRATTRAERRST